ncbi:MAG: DUF885 family protein, partial [Bacteroidota bacterium]
MNIGSFRTTLVFTSCLCALAIALQAQDARTPHPQLQSLAKEFFAWRAATQPATYDDIPRVERPNGWTPDVSPEAFTRQEARYHEFSKRLDDVPRSGWTRSDSVDYLLLRSAIERVNWELSYLKSHVRNPDFYCNQTLGAVYELLLISSPITDERMRNILLRLESFPTTTRHATMNLKDPVLPFAQLALANITDARGKLERMAAGLKLIADRKFHSRLDNAVVSAAKALE